MNQEKLRHDHKIKKKRVKETETFVLSKSLRAPFTCNDKELCYDGIKIGLILDFEKVSIKKRKNLFSGLK